MLIFYVCFQAYALWFVYCTCNFLAIIWPKYSNDTKRQGIEVDKAKIDVMKKLPPPISVKGIRSFLGHAKFYRKFIKDFSKISEPLCKLLEKDSMFNFDYDCLKAFEDLKKRLISTPIIIT
ncbi:Retrovirus-related Pol polyprotein from transposon opus [Gossypium australe]|uniref:Retrovirus-related Pol polyprotein from transposon opus n=1 Tax=Gossypium australe TaxID=47621 RepID=A0A5B6WFF5_9ROSI|nr:Retrovirus-related Pol polyprotein from transposon opus [Gossypium australe]